MSSLVLSNLYSFLIGYFAQGEIDLSGFSSILFLFLGLGTVALAIAISLIVLKVILDIVGIDIIGIGRTVFGRKG